jgi:uncharacterized YigZ family protein
MNYFTIKVEAEEIHIEKKSKFIAYTFPIKSENIFKEALADLKEIHPKANHHCWAYIFGDNSEIEKCSDDGEPSGAAGLPILGQLKSKELTYSACVVVRYFGGIKLGKGGMIKAYKEAARQSIECTEIIEREVCVEYMVKVKYAHVDRIMQLIKRNNINTMFQDISETSIFRLEVPLNIVEYIDSVLESFAIQFSRELPN